MHDKHSSEYDTIWLKKLITLRMSQKIIEYKDEEISNLSRQYFNESKAYTRQH